MAGVTSMKVPASRRTAFIIRSRAAGLDVNPKRAAETAWGICVKAMTQPRILDTPMRNTTIPLILALSVTIRQNERTVIFP